jgi:hypothetical protein
VNARAELLGKDTPYTHAPMLVLAFFGTQDHHGPILEMGMGYGSTCLLSRLCEQSGRLLVSVDSDPAWAEEFRPLECGTHQIKAHPGWAGMVYDPPAPWERWAVAFVDHAPGEHRAMAIRNLRQVAEFIVVHDADATGYGWGDSLDTFKWRHDYRVLCPGTTILSEFRDPATLF